MDETAQSWTSPCFDIAGFGFEVVVGWAQRSTVLASESDFPTHRGPADVRVRWSSGQFDLGPLTFTGEDRGRQYARHPDGLVARHGALTALVTATSIELRGASDDTEAQLDDYRTVLSAALACWLSHRSYFPIHGAAAGRDGKVLLLLGHPGAGKSSAAWAAHRAGFDLVGDDLVIVRDAAGGPELTGMATPVAIPGELLEQIPEGASQSMFKGDGGGRRDRWGLVPDMLTPGWHRVIGLVVPTHGDDPAGALIEADRSAVFPLAVAKYFAADDEEQLRSWFPHAAKLARLPAWELRHTPQVGGRLEVAAHWIGVAFDQALAATGTDEG